MQARTLMMIVCVLIAMLMSGCEVVSKMNPVSSYRTFSSAEIEVKPVPTRPMVNSTHYEEDEPPEVVRREPGDPPPEMVYISEDDIVETREEGLERCLARAEECFSSQPSKVAEVKAECQALYDSGAYNTILVGAAMEPCEV